MDKLKYVIVSFLVMVFFLTEYTWIPWEEVPVFYKVPFVTTMEPVRLDALIYAASVKLGHVIPFAILFFITPFKKESKLMMIAFALAIPELFLTWNEPVMKLPMPFGLWIPISTSLLKLGAICNFMWACVVKALKE
jgi:hypothetical protein